jgi:hypothetical protein
VVVAGRWGGRVLLSSGLLAAALLGGVGGYGAGLVTTQDVAVATGVAKPLSPATTPTPPTPGSTPGSSLPPKKVVPDDTPALPVDELRYKSRTFTAKSVVQSTVSLRVPSNWTFTQPDPPIHGRYTDPTTKRWIRIEAGFSIRRAPEESMAAKLKNLTGVPKNQLVTIVSKKVDPKTNDATLVYTYVPDQSVRYVIVRWIANADGLCELEMAVTGLPQDKEALTAILDRATETAVRTDEPLG